MFFSGCSLRCVFCQNHEISKGLKGKDISVETLADEFLKLKDMGASNINLVTPTHFVNEIVKALDKVKSRLDIPVLYNCGGYEKPETVRLLEAELRKAESERDYMRSRMEFFREVAEHRKE